MQLTPIARVLSPYQEKFGAPRQPGLVPAARGWLEMEDAFAQESAFEGLEGFSHIWVVFGFHACGGQHRLRVRPPRLGGNQEMGVFATRSPFRPNHLGLSVLTYEGLERVGSRLRLKVSGLDVIDDTPVYDIKPYVPYTDSIPAASGGFADLAPEADLEVVFSEAAAARLLETGPAGSELRDLIVQTLSLDPRPAYRGGGDERVYGVSLSGHNVRWRYHGDHIEVLQIERR